jgi:predicted metal-binding membrane protein
MPQGAVSAVAERAVRHDRALALLAIAAITVLSWIYLVRMASMMTAAAGERAMHAAMGMPEMAAWGPAELLMLFLMWAVMMTGMMLPSAAPLILLVIGTYRRRGDRARLLTFAFASGYLVAWTGFSAIAASLQLLLHRAALLSPSMSATSVLLGGAMLLAAGVYQWLPIKGACLTHCRSPLAFLGTHWRDGVRGALAMGLRHGAFCIGCCWALMLLLFAAGVMNLFWVGAVAAFVLVEKLAPGGGRIGRIAGVLLVAWGAWILASV